MAVERGLISRRDPGDIPLQLSAIRIPLHGIPVPVDAKPRTIWHERVPGPYLELCVEELVQSVQPGRRIHVLESGRVQMGQGRSKMDMDRCMDVGGNLQATSGCKCRRSHKFPYTSDDRCVAADHVDRAGLDEVVEGAVSTKVLAQSDEHPRSAPQVSYERGETFGERVFYIREAKTLEQA